MPRAPEPVPVPTPAEDRAGYQFGRAIEQLNPQFMNFLGRYYKSKNEEMTRQFSGDLAALSPEDAKAYYEQQRKIVSSDYVGVLDNQYGLRKAYQDFNTVQADLKSGNIDLALTSLDDVLDVQVSAALDNAPSGEFRAGYQAVMAQVVPQIRAFEQEYRASELRKEADQNFFQIGVDIVQHGTQIGSLGADIHDAVRSLYKEYGPGTKLNMSRTRMDELVIDIAAWAADQGYEDAAVSLLTSDRPGEDGKTIPSLAKTKRHADRVDTVLKTAKARKDEKLAEENFGRLVDLYRRAANGDNVEALLNQSPDVFKRLLSPQQTASLIGTAQSAREKAAREAQKAATAQEAGNIVSGQVTAMTAEAFVDPTAIHNVQGISETLSSDPSQKAELGQKETEQLVVDNVMRSLGVTPGFSPLEDPNVTAQVVNWLGQSGYKWDPLVTKMKTAWKTLGAANVANGTIPKPVMESLSWYENMEAQGYGSLAQDYLGGGKDAAFYDTALFLERNVYNGDRTSALQETARRLEQSQSLTDEQLAAPTRDERQRYRTKVVDSLNSFGDGEGDLENTGAIDRAVRRAANSYITLGWDRTSAYDRAAEVVAKNYKVINGWAISTTDVQVPKNIRDITKYVAEKFVESGLGDAWDITDPNDLVLAPSNDGSQTVWQLQSKTIGMLPTSRKALDWEVAPGETVKLPAGTFTVKDLTKVDKARLQSLKKAISEKQEENIAQTQIYGNRDVNLMLDWNYGAGPAPETAGVTDQARQKVRQASNSTLTALYGTLEDGNDVKKVVEEEIARRGLNINTEE